jgi:hypothetical protein
VGTDVVDRLDLQPQVDIRRPLAQPVSNAEGPVLEIIFVGICFAALILGGAHTAVTAPASGSAGGSYTDAVCRALASAGAEMMTAAGWVHRLGALRAWPA